MGADGHRRSGGNWRLRYYPVTDISDPNDQSTTRGICRSRLHRRSCRPCGAVYDIELLMHQVRRAADPESHGCVIGTPTPSVRGASAPISQCVLTGEFTLGGRS